VLGIVVLEAVERREARVGLEARSDLCERVDGPRPERNGIHLGGVQAEGPRPFVPDPSLVRNRVDQRPVDVE
jgi:hypothetical protein